MTGKQALVALLCYRYFEIISGMKMKIFLPRDDDSIQILDELQYILSIERHQNIEVLPSLLSESFSLLTTVN